MVLLIITTLFGLLLVSVFHFLSLLHVYEPPKQITFLIQMWFLITFLSWCIISKKMRADECSKKFNTSIRDVCPKWMASITGIFILYAFMGLFYSFLEKYNSSSSITSEGVRGNYYGSFPGYWMGLYSLMLALLYSCRCLKKKEGK